MADKVNELAPASVGSSRRRVRGQDAGGPVWQDAMDLRLPGDAAGAGTVLPANPGHPAAKVVVPGSSVAGRALRCVAASEDDTLLSCHTTPVCMWALDSDPRRFRNIWELCGPRSLVPPFSRLTFGKHEHLWYQITRVPRP